MRSPLTGFVAYEPVKTPVFSRSVDRRSISLGCARGPRPRRALPDGGATPPASPVGPPDLLARRGPVVGAPVDRRLAPMGRARLQEPQEQPLVPAVELGLAGHQFVAPV